MQSDYYHNYKNADKPICPVEILQDETVSNELKFRISEAHIMAAKKNKPYCVVRMDCVSGLGESYICVVSREYTYSAEFDAFEGEDIYDTETGWAGSREV
jgi:hypothetical protein